MAYTRREYFNMVRLYFENHGNSYRAERAYRENYPDLRCPTPRTIRHAVNRLEVDGRLEPIEDRARVRPVATVALEELILEIVREDPRTSVRTVGRLLGVSKSLVHRILRMNGQHPYHFTRVQELRITDYPRRVEFCVQLIEQVDVDRTFLSRIVWTDECIFRRYGSFNQHNSHEWGEVNPFVTRDSSFQSRWSIHLWVGLVDDELIGPVVLPDRLNGDTYLNLLRDMPRLLNAENHPERMLELIYQHDGAPAHFGIDVRQHLNEMFPDRWIGRAGPTEWPPRSPDLNPLDFYLWGTIKEIVYKEKILSRDHLQERLWEAFVTIDRQVIRRATQSMYHRAQRCVAEDGRHFQHIPAR